MAIMAAGVMPCMRIMARIIVLHMSAQFMHAGAQSIICVEQTVHACSQAAHASMHACIMAMSISAMPSIDIMSLDMALIIIASIPEPTLFFAARRVPARRHAKPDTRRATGAIRLVIVTSQGIHIRIRATVALALALVLTAFAAPAFAHDELIGSTPAAGSAVDALPNEVALTFSGVLLDETGTTDVVVKDAAGTDLAAGDPVLDGTRLTQPLTGDASGLVTVIWRVVSSDGHPVSGEFSFTVGDGATVPTATGLPLPDPQAPPSGPIWIVLGIVVVGLGGALVAVLVARTRRPRED